MGIIRLAIIQSTSSLFRHVGRFAMSGGRLLATVPLEMKDILRDCVADIVEEHEIYSIFSSFPPSL